MAIAAESSRIRTNALRGRGLRRGRTWLLVVGDVAALAVSYAATYVAANRIAPPAVEAPRTLLLVLAFVAVPVWVSLFTAYHLYDNDNLRISTASFDELGDVFHALLAGSLAFLLLAQVLRRLEDWRIFSAIEALLFLMATIVLIPLVRGTMRSWVFPRLMSPRRAMIIGAGPDARLVQRKLETHPEYGLEVVAILDGEDLQHSDAGEMIDELEIDRVVLASSIGDHEEAIELVRSVRRPDVQVSIVPRYSEIFTSRALLDDVEGMPLVTLPPVRLGRSSRVLKRGTDMLLSGVLLVLLAPVLALIALAIRIDSKGSVFYRQPRRGREGSTFTIVKFRSMYVGAEQKRREVLHLNDVDGPLFKVKGVDPRITRVGRFIRRTSLDELPQLWNVLRGHMSLVGPRPFVIYEADKITGWARHRLDMAPGITGLWQVLGRNDIPFEEMVKLDYLYVTNWSLWWDMKILCQTVPAVLGKRGAY
jgi:exopolysaccharide biosynthesis polyprenyl glycosylphosphotransferase